MRTDKRWFEMGDLRRRRLNDAVWIPLRSAEYLRNVGRYGQLGHEEEFYGVGTLLVPLEHRQEASTLGWMDVGISHSHRPFVDNGEYVAADRYSMAGRAEGTHLILERAARAGHTHDWLVHPDLLLGFGLLQEGDAWVSPDDGYETVIETRRDENGSPRLVAIKAEYLKDYLAARNAALYVTSYRSRRRIVEGVSFTWEPDEWVGGGGVRWEGRVNEIHEGGMPFGERTAVIHVAHNDFDREQDVPVLPHPTEGEYDSRTWEVEHQGRRLFFIQGELWKEEWVEPAPVSPRIRGDRLPSTASFIVDASGARKRGDELSGEGRWLWFRPDVVPALANRRGGSLSWYTRDTGGVECVPSPPTAFGINRLGLVNIYAKDITYLPDWQQRIWSGFNVPPEGGVSAELQAAQVGGEPAKTLAPEPFLQEALDTINVVSVARFSKVLVREHEQLHDILRKIHRFRAVDGDGLLALAKDLARVTADSFDGQAIRDILGTKESLGSLKSMERLLAKDIGEEGARIMMGPLSGIYELRLRDAHLPKSEKQAAFKLARIDVTLPLVHQGGQLIASCVSALFDIAEVLEHRGPPKPSDT